MDLEYHNMEGKTVKMSMEDYEEMKREIERLERLVKEGVVVMEYTNAQVFWKTLSIGIFWFVWFKAFNIF